LMSCCTTCSGTARMLLWSSPLVTNTLPHNIFVPLASGTPHFDIGSDVLIWPRRAGLELTFTGAVSTACRRPRAVHVVGDTDRERATTRTTRCGRSAASAASRTVGPTYSANGFGPVIQVIVPAGHRPASRNPCGPSAAR
jgi:hypothetical protein